MLTNAKPSFAVVLDTRRQTTTGKNSGKYHIKTRVTFIVSSRGKTKWIRKYYPSGLFATMDEFESIVAKNPPRDADLKKIRTKLKSIENQVSDIIEEVHIHDQATFEVHFLSSGSIKQIDGLFNSKISELEEAEKYSTAEKYRTALTVIKKFAGDYVTYGEINQKWLGRFKAWYSTKKNKKGEIVQRSMASFAFHVRALRHIFRVAISLKLIEPDMYPFGMGKFKIPAVRRAMKRYLSPVEKDKILEYKSSSQTVNYYKDLWVFSFFCNGMNFADIALLKRRDVHSDHILIQRQKTKDTDSVSQKILIPLLDEAKEIIARHGTKSLAPSGFVFPILQEGDTEKDRFKKVRALILKTNKAMEGIRQELKIEGKVTTYTARHTHSNILLINGAPLEVLQANLGHASKKTTEIYKGGFSLEILKEYAKNLKHVEHK